MCNDKSHAVKKIIKQVYLIALLIMGLPGNALVISYLGHRNFRKHPSSHFLIVMCISDIVYLLVLFLLVLTNFGLPILHNNIICQGTAYITFVCDFITAYMITMCTAQRFAAIVVPFKSMVYSQHVRKIAIATACLFGVLWYTYILVAINSRPANMTGTGELSYVCGGKPEYKTLLRITALLDSVAVFIIPYSIMLILNIQIFRKLTGAQQLNINRVPLSSMNSQQTGKVQTARSKMTKIMLITSTAYMVVNAPYHISSSTRVLMGSYLSLEIGNKMRHVESEYLLYLYYCRLALNYYIYAVFVSGFRDFASKHLRGTTKRNAKAGEELAGDMSNTTNNNDDDLNNDNVQTEIR